MLKNMKSLVTETSNKLSLHIDEEDTKGILNIINIEDKKVPVAVTEVIDDIAKAVDGIVNVFNNGGRLIYIGAGTSGRLGILDASECTPTYGVDSNMVQGLIAGGKEAVFSAKEGAEDSEELAFHDLMKINLSSNDIVCGLAASGRTPYAIGGLKYAKQIGAKTISICCTNNGMISDFADYPIEVIVGPEVVTGSTRMKSGTAQKLVLNMLSTASMIKIGKVYGNLMVDVQLTNEKLRNRAVNIVMECGNVDEIKACELLDECNGEVKIAILKCLTNYSVEQCILLLKDNDNNISKSIKGIVGD